MASQGLQFEEELELELEEEDEDFFGNIGSLLGKVGGLLGEGELEDEYEEEDEWELEEESEWEDEDEDEDFLGPIMSGISGLLGESEEEDEWEDEDEAEAFFGGIGKWLKKAAPILRTIAKTAGPLVATAVGGPAAGALARAVTSQLEGEEEDEAELEEELEQAVSKPLNGTQALAELMAAQATQAESESEAEALIGAASLSAISAQDRRELAALVPHLVSGAAVLTRLLYGNKGTRQALRTIPTIVDETAGTIQRRLADGTPVSRVEAGRIMGRHADRLLGSPRRGQSAMRRHYRGVRSANSHHGAHHRRGHGHHGGRGHAAFGAPTYRTRTGQHHRSGAAPHHGAVRGTAVRTSVHSRTPTGRPRAGTMRVVTPVRIPAKGGQPSRTVRVVTDVRVPRGAVPAAKATVQRAAPARAAAPRRTR